MKLGELKGKKIAIVGLGVNNRNLAAYFKHHDIAFDVLENWRLPADLVGKLDQYQMIFRTPGLPYLSQAIQQAKLSGAEISSQTKLFFELCPAPIIGITGTKGKGTTASLLAKILSAAGKTVWLAGNIGLDPFEFLDQIKPTDSVIMELSSFQLQDMTVSPHVAVVLNITSDHLDHHETVTEYALAKEAILAFQSGQDLAVLDPKLPDRYKNLGAAKKFFFDRNEAANFPTQLLGHHNQDNIAAAVATARLLGVIDDVAKSAISEFKPLPHHLEILRTVNGITYVDDSVSTNAEPTIAAIGAFSTPIILIVGGHEKGVDFNAVGQKIISSPNVKAVIVIGEVTEKILRSLQGYQGQILTGAKNMKEILTQAQSVAVAGDTILMSPGTSSFGMFQNMYDRAEQFVNAVNAL